MANELSQNQVADYFKAFIGPKELPKGIFLCLVSEPTSKVLRPYFSKELAMGTSSLRCTLEKEVFERWVHESIESPEIERILLVVERSVAGKNHDAFIIELCKLYGDHHKVEVLMISQEISQDKAALWHERGVSAITYYPVNQAKITTKMASIIQPESKLFALKKKAQAFIMLGKMKEAKAVIDEMIFINGTHHACLFLKGEYLLVAGYPEEAMACYKSSMAASAEYIEPLRRMADALKEAGRGKEAIKYLETLDKISPLNYDRKINIGTIYAADGDLDSASTWIEAALKTAKAEKAEDIKAMEDAITALINPDDSKEAKRALLRAGIGVDQNMADKLNAEGRALIDEKKYIEAMKKFQEAMTYSPLDEKVYFNLARCFEHTNRNKQMVATLQELLDINPDYGNDDIVITRILSNMIYASTSSRFSESERFYGKERQDLLDLAFRYYEKYLPMIENDEVEKERITRLIGEIRAGKV